MASGSNTFKILPTFADGKLTNTLHIPDSGEELANGITIKILPTLPELQTINVASSSVSGKCLSLRELPRILDGR